jgi:glycosyltransferase involved in cell wall biosynthesis
MMRVAFDYQIFAGQTYGGISRYFAQLALGLAHQEQQVGVFSPLYRNVYLSELPGEMVHGRYFSRYPPKTASLILAYNRFRSKRIMAKWRPDLVHETYYSMTGSAPPSCPVVITVHDMIHDLFPDNSAANDKTIAAKRNAVERADHVICISHNTKLDLMRLYNTPDSKISVVHLGFDRFTNSPDLHRYATPTGKPYILYVGGRAGYKNFSGLLKAVSSSDKLLADFDIVAFGGGEFSASELAEISSLGFSDTQVRYQGGGDELLGALYSSARAFVYPSLYEGFGIPPLEAMAHRCPVICSNAGPLPEVVGDAVEFFDPEDVESMRNAIGYVVFSPERSDQLISSGLERLKQFSWEKCSEETLDVYNRVLHG